MRTTGTIFASIVALFLAASLSAQVNDTYVIPASAHTAGENGTFWVTDADLFNPHSYTLKVTLIFLPSGGAQGSMIKLDVFPNENFSVDDIVAKAFQRSGTGALLAAVFAEDNPTVTDSVMARSFLVQSRTFNDDPDGTYGQNVPGVWAGLQNYDTDNISGLVNGVVNSASTTTGFRTNIGAVNLGRYSVTLRVSVYNGDGDTILDRAPFTVPPQGHIHDRLPITVFYGTVEFFVEDPTGDGIVFPYATIVDNESGDSIFRGAILYAPASVLYSSASAKQATGSVIGTAVARRAASRAKDLGTLVRAAKRVATE